MAIDFNVLNQQGALPDFISRLQQPAQQQESSGGLTAAQAAQLNMNYAQDQRQAKIDEVKLAREKQAMGLDVNADNRAGLMNSAQIERLGNQTAIDWAKFVKDSDIADKNYRLAKDKQKTDKEFRREELDFNKKLETDKFGLQSKMTDKQIEWGDRGADREDQKFQFDIKKWDYKNQKDQEFADTLKKAREQGAEAYSNALLDKGLVQEASTFLDVTAKLQTQKDTKLNKEQEQSKELVYIDMAADVLSGKKIPLNKVINFANTVYGPKVAATIDEENAQNFIKTGFISAFGPRLESIAKSGEAANLIAAQNGFAPLKTKMTTGQMDERSKQLSGDYQKLQSMNELEGLMESMIEDASNSYTIGTGPEWLQGTWNSALATAQKGINKFVDTGTSAIDEDSRSQAFGLKKARAAQLMAETFRGSDGRVIPAAMDAFESAMDSGPEGLKQFVELSVVPQKITNETIGVLADAFPGDSYDQLHKRAAPYIQDLVEIRQKLGRDLTIEEKEQYYNETVKR